jgi:hypothetical protein
LIVFAIVTHLYVAYCPGGISEKQNLLKSLEDPPEISTLGESPAALRKWLRWRQHATEIGATTPDPTLLVRGLVRMTKRVLESNRELHFRVSLARHALGIDTVPTLDSVTKFATHLLSECEQLSQTEKKKPAPATKNEVKVKSLDYDKEESKGKGKGKERSFEDEKGERRRKCKFYLTTEGCRKGKECRYSHAERDGKRRCYTCGSTEHMAPDCPRKPSTEGSPPKQKTAKAEGDQVPGGAKGSEDQGGEAETMKGLIEEANKMLRSLTSSSAAGSSASSTSEKEEDSRSEVLSRLQAQLNSLKTFKLVRITNGMSKGLIDSGATHPLRPTKSFEDDTNMKEVEVSLADGGSVRLHMTAGGSMVTAESNVEPIVPMGMLIDVLGCEVAWKKGSLQVLHPCRGLLPVEDCGGCPQISRKLALDLIQEMEEARCGVQAKRLDFEEEVQWMNRLVEVHPVLSKLPD